MNWTDAEFEIVLYYYLTEFDKYFPKKTEDLVILTNKINDFCGNNRTVDSIYMRFSNYLSVDESKPQKGLTGGDQACFYYFNKYKNNPDAIRSKYPNFFNNNYEHNYYYEFNEQKNIESENEEELKLSDSQIDNYISSDDKENSEKQISIIPTSGVYGTYKRMSYKPWFAIAEFIDNSTQSFFNNKEALQNEEGFKKLLIKIRYDQNEDVLEIIDNAYGMDFEDFSRALVLDKPPKKRDGRNEFGMGLKTAACWFGNEWTVETTRLGVNKQYIATMNVANLVKNHDSSVNYIENDISFDTHYTKITINNLLQKPQKRTIGKIKTTLARMYRSDITSGEIEIQWNGEILTYEDPILRKEDGKEVKKEVRFSVEDAIGNSYDVSGWMGVLENGSYNNAGFALMRRGRVVVGAVENYKPSEIFGGSGGDYRRLYLVGELNLDNFPVTQAKDGFEWDINGLEENFLDKLHSEGKDIIKKASNMVNVNKAKKTEEINKETVNDIINDVQEGFSSVSIEKENLSDVEIEDQSKDVNKQEYHSYITNKSDVTIASQTSNYMMKLSIDGYEFNVYWNDDENANWIAVKNIVDEYGVQTGVVNIYINIRHRFFVPYSNNPEFLKIINKIAIALVIAEKKASLESIGDGSKVSPESIRHHMNRCLEIISDKENEWKEN